MPKKELIKTKEPAKKMIKKNDKLINKKTEEMPVGERKVDKKKRELKKYEKKPEVEKPEYLKTEKDKAIMEMPVKEKPLIDIVIKSILDTDEPSFVKLERLNALLRVVKDEEFVKVSNAIRKKGDEERKIWESFKRIELEKRR